MQASLSGVLKDFNSQIDSSQNLIKKVKDIGIPRIQVEIITELAFLRISIAWENFLEESFIRYSVGAKSISGHVPTRLLEPHDMTHAFGLLSQGKDYIKWNSASGVVRRAELYFRDGEPYKNIIQSITVDLDNVNIIRNRIAHKSSISKKNFTEFARRKFGYGKRGMTPGRFLLTPTPTDTQIIFLDYYISIFKTASLIIVK